MAVNAVEHLVFGAYGVDDLAEADFLRLGVDGQVGLGKGNSRKQDSDK